MKFGTALYLQTTYHAQIIFLMGERCIAKLQVEHKEYARDSVMVYLKILSRWNV